MPSRIIIGFSGYELLKIAINNYVGSSIIHIDILVPWLPDVVDYIR